jgi:hypothetical protein
VVSFRALVKGGVNKLFCNIVKEAQSNVLYYIRFLQYVDFIFLRRGSASLGGRNQTFQAKTLLFFLRVNRSINISWSHGVPTHFLNSFNKNQIFVRIIYRPPTHNITSFVRGHFPTLTLLWYHERSYVNSTMGSIWPHCKKKQNKKTVYYNVFFSPNNIAQHRLYWNIDRQTRLCLRILRIYRSR